MNPCKTGAALSAALLIFAFSPGHSAEPRYGGSLKIGLWTDITHLNPFLDNRSTDTAVRSIVFEGLVDWNRDFSVVPCLAESWTISRDGKLYTFRLRRGVKFHNGKELTSEDVKWSLEYIIDPKNGAYQYSGLRVIEAIETPDSHTVRVFLKSPSAPFLSDVGTSRALIAPKGSVTERRPRTFPPGTGPFEFEEWKPSEGVTLRKNRSYWQKGIPYLDGVVMRPMPDDQIRFTALRTGEADLVAKVPEKDAQEIKRGSISGFNLSMGEASNHNRLRMNLRKPPLNDVRVRQAIAFALDKQEIVEAVTWGLGKPIYWRYPKNTRWFMEMEDRKQDLKRARALLDAAGFSRGVRLALPIHTGSLHVGQVVQAQLSKAGIEINLETMDRGAYRERISKRDFDMVISGGNLTPDPDSLLYDAFHSKFVDHQNESGYQNPDLDRVIEEARVISDFEKRKALYTEALGILIRDVPEIPLYTFPNIYGFRAAVKGFEAEDTGGLSFNSNRGGVPITWLDR